MSPHLGHQVLGGGVEVVEDVLLVEQAAGVVPALAVLAAAADVGDGHDAAEVLHEHQPRHAEARLHVDVEAAVAVDQRRVGAVAGQVLEEVLYSVPIDENKYIIIKYLQIHKIYVFVTVSYIHSIRDF